MKRREFLELSILTASVAILPIPGCGTAVPTFTRTGDTLRIPETAFQTGSTARPEGSRYMVVKEEGSKGPILLNQLASGSYNALLLVCTHKGCEVPATDSNRLVCPCHASAFDATSGSVLKAPATAPLTTYRVTSDGDHLVIHLA